MCVVYKRKAQELLPGSIPGYAFPQEREKKGSDYMKKDFVAIDDIIMSASCYCRLARQAMDSGNIDAYNRCMITATALENVVISYYNSIYKPWLAFKAHTTIWEGFHLDSDKK